MSYHEMGTFTHLYVKTSATATTQTKRDAATITQEVLSMHTARQRGYFANEAFPGDWTGRAAKRPDDKLFAYFIGDTLIGFVDGEEAIFSTLAEWVDAYNAQ